MTTTTTTFADDLSGQCLDGCRTRHWSRQLAAGATAAFDASARTADRCDGARGLAPRLWWVARRNAQRSTGTDDRALSRSAARSPWDPGPAQVVDAVMLHVAALGPSSLVPRLAADDTLDEHCSRWFSGLARCRSEGSRRRSGGRERRTRSR